MEGGGRGDECEASDTFLDDSVRLFILESGHKWSVLLLKHQYLSVKLSALQHTDAWIKP